MGPRAADFCARGWRRVDSVVSGAQNRGMPASSLPQKASATMLYLVFGAVVSSFLITTIVTQGASREVESLSDEIKETRRRTVWLLNGLTAFSVILGLAGAMLIDRQTRSRRTLVE